MRFRQAKAMRWGNGWLPAALAVCAAIAAAPVCAAESVDQLLRQRSQLYEAFRKYEHFKQETEATALAADLADLERRLVTATLAEMPVQTNRVQAARLALMQTLEWLAKRHEKRQQLDGAEQARRELLSVTRDQYGPDHFRTRDAQLGLENLQLLRKLLSEKPDQMKQAARLNSELGKLSEEGNYFEALTKARELLKLRKELLGEQHPDVILLTAEMGYLNFAAGQLQEAERLSREAVMAWRSVLGERHPQFASGLANLGMFYMQMGQSAAAESLFRQASDVWRNALGDRDPQYARSQATLAELYVSIGSMEQAEECYRRAEDIYREVLGVEHREYLACLCNHGLVLAELGRWDDAQQRVMQALELRQTHLGPEDQDTIRNLLHLAELYRARGAPMKAEAIYKQVAALWKKTRGERDDYYGMVLERLVEFYTTTGNEAQAKHYAAELARIRTLPSPKQ